MVRAFICIEISEVIKATIAELQKDLAGIQAAVGWVKPSNIHLTVKFLGGVPESQIDAIVGACREAAFGISPFEITIGGIGCFPSPRSPRVLWVGVTAAPKELTELQKNVEERLAALGFAKEMRKFAPHLAIGRLKSKENAWPLVEALQQHGFASEVSQVREIIVMRSDLNPKGAVYTPLAVVPIGGAD